MAAVQPLKRTRFRAILLASDGLSESDRFKLTDDLLVHGFDVSLITAIEQVDEIQCNENERLCLLIAEDLPQNFASLTESSNFNNGANKIIDLRKTDLDTIVLTLQKLENPEFDANKKQKRWKPWFPVIDFARCTNCMQCLSFCLFDVYGVDSKGNIQVQNQSNCKTDCPACSRVCPDVAILFPKYHHGPINGDQVKEEDVRREAMKVDISSLLGGDIYKLLRERSAKAKSRFSRERDDKRALKERKRCLTKLKDSMGISDEILASLPSLDQIQQKATDAKKKAEAALELQRKTKADQANEENLSD